MVSLVGKAADSKSVGRIIRFYNLQSRADALSDLAAFCRINILDKILVTVDISSGRFVPGGKIHSVWLWQSTGKVEKID